MIKKNIKFEFSENIIKELKENGLEVSGYNEFSIFFDKVLTKDENKKVLELIKKYYK